MCNEIRRGHIWQTRNNSLVLIVSAVAALVLASNDPAVPGGSKIEYKSEHGHVMCEGSNNPEEDAKCELHPWDVRTFAGHIDDVAAFTAGTPDPRVTVSASNPKPAAKTEIDEVRAMGDRLWDLSKKANHPGMKKMATKVHGLADEIEEGLTLKDMHGVVTSLHRHMVRTMKDAAENPKAETTAPISPDLREEDLAGVAKDMVGAT